MPRLDVPMVERQEPAKIANRADLAPIKFGAMSFKLRRGTKIGTYEQTLLAHCYPFNDAVYWNRGRVHANDVEYADLFFEAMRDANFNVVGNPRKMFKDESPDVIKPAYLVGGQIEEIRMNVCDRASIWNGRRLGIQSGKGYVKVKWQVFSLFDRKTVFEAETTGYADIEEPSANGELVILTEAFAEAAANLAANEDLVALLSKGAPALVDIRATEDIRLLIPRRKLFDGSIAENIDRIRLGVVRIDSETGHGSGFFISPSLIMTNVHVVRGSSIVRVVLVTGRKILGEVIRTHEKRDVALIQVESGGHQPLPLRLEPLKITEEVFAVGSPLKNIYSGTVTKGIVSKFNTNNYGLEDIQADVDIQGGNSGGALLDANGNLVGVTYAGIGENSIGMNFFIPIYDALEKLNIAFMKKKAASGS